MKNRGQYVISDTKGEFFLTTFSIDGRCYLKDDQWVISTGVLVFRWPGMFETLDREETERALLRWELEAKEMGRGELLKKIEKAFPIREWIKRGL
jgi:hypothetical protein